jgi:hypothetical protein
MLVYVRIGIIWLVLEFYDFHYLIYRSQTKYQILLTKSDAVFPIDVARRAMQIEEVSFAHMKWKSIK